MNRLHPKSKDNGKNVAEMEAAIEAVEKVDEGQKISGIKMIRRRISLTGLRPCMFNKYPGDNETRLPPEEKLYYDVENNKKTICMPARNLISFLSAENTKSAPQILLGKNWKKVAQACLSYVEIGPEMIPFTKNGKPIIFGSFPKDQDRDPLSGIYQCKHCPRVKGGIPQPVIRVVLPLPWELNFNLTMLPNRQINEAQVRDLFERGGIAVALGTYRPVYGKFLVTGWKELTTR